MNRFGRALARTAAVALAAHAACGAASLGQAPPPPHLAIFVDGTQLPGTVADLADPAKANIAGRRLFDPAKPVRFVQLDGAADTSPASYVEFDNGDRLPGTVVGHRPEGFVWRTMVGAVQPMNHAESLPATLEVATFADVLAPDRPMSRPICGRRIAGPTATRIDVRRDRVRRVVWRHDAARRHQPRTAFLTDGSVRTFRSLRWSGDAVLALLEDGSTERLPFDALAELHLAPRAAPRAAPWDAWFESLADDPAGVVQLQTRTGVRVTTPRGRYRVAPGLPSILVQPTWSLDPLFLPVAGIARIFAFAQAEAPLSWMQPSRMTQRSPFGASWTWQADRNVQGGPLDPAGPPAGWGFGVQARTELAFPLCEGIREFRVRVGLDRVVGGGGCVLASVHANDANSPALWQSGILVGSGTFAACGSLAIAGPAGGHKEIVLVADDAHRDRPPGADPFDIRDTVDWVDPLVVFDPAVVAQRTAARLAFLVPAWTGWTVAADPPARVRLVAATDPILGSDRAGWAGATVAEGGPLRLSRTWQALRPHESNLVIAASAVGQGKGAISLRVDGWQWELPVPPRSHEPVVPFVLPLARRAEGPLAVEVVAPPGLQVQWHALGLAGPLDEGWFPLEPVKMESSGGSKFRRRGDDAVLVSMPPPKQDDYTIRLKSPQGGIRALRIDALLDPSLAKPYLGPGRHTNGIFRLSGLTVSAGRGDDEQPLGVVAAYCDPLNPAGHGPLEAVRRTPRSHWVGNAGVTQSAVLHFRDDEAAPEDIVLAAEFRAADHESLGCFRVYGSADPEARLAVTRVVHLTRAPDPPGRPPRQVVVGKPLGKAATP